MIDQTRVEIESRDYWVKVIEMLQQNWALIDTTENGCILFFVHDLSGVFDRIEFDSVREAELALRRNGFRRFSEDKRFAEFLAVPEPPFFEDEHPNGPIYSSGQYWN